MLHLVILLLLSISLCFWLNKSLKKQVMAKIKAYEALSAEYQKLQSENASIKQSNANLERSVEETIALYDVTKDICKSLEEDKMFGLFKKSVNRYIKARECVFLKPDVNLNDYKDFTVSPFIVNKNIVGHLAVRCASQQDKEKCYILSQQFSLGVGRALLYKKVQELTIVDSLTQVYSRRYFLEKLDEEINRSKKFKISFSFLMVDVDNFKKVNDNYGHLVGDVILREVSKSIKDSIRQIDFMGRYGGEELSVVLTETDRNEALVVAERIRQAVESNQITAYDESLKVTISIGISLFPAHATEALMLIDKADQALYKAKQSGRNKVVLLS